MSQKDDTRLNGISDDAVPERYATERERRAYQAGRLIANGDDWAAVAARFGHRCEDRDDSAHAFLGWGSSDRNAFLEGLRHGELQAEAEGLARAGLTLRELARPEIEQWRCWKCGHLRRGLPAEGQTCLVVDEAGDRCEGSYEYYPVPRDERLREAAARAFLGHVDRRRGGESEDDEVRRIATPLAAPEDMGASSDAETSDE